MRREHDRCREEETMELTADTIRTERCAAAFDRMFWAFLFFLDFRIGINNVHVDILPDFIGWIMMASALFSLVDMSSTVRGIRTLACWLVFLSLFDLLEIRIPLGRSGAFHTWITPTLPIGIAAAVLDVIVVWRLCGFIMDMASAVDNPVIKGRAEFRRKLYLALVVIISVSVWISFLVPPFLLLALVVGLPLSIVVFCLMMGLMKGTARMCRGEAV